jgi:hypothetical protein
MSLLKAFLEALAESAQQAARSSPVQGRGRSQSNDQNQTLRYVGQVEGARGVVGVQVTRIANRYQNIFRIEGRITTPAGRWGFEADGHSGYGKLHDESIVHLQIDERSLAITINPYDPPAPTYYFRRA